MYRLVNNLLVLPLLYGWNIADTAQNPIQSINQSTSTIVIQTDYSLWFPTGKTNSCYPSYSFFPLRKNYEIKKKDAIRLYTGKKNNNQVFFVFCERCVNRKNLMTIH